jgi:tRNA 2-thiouridine synthesizing protein E
MLNIQQAEAFPRKQPRNHEKRNIKHVDRYKGLQQRADKMGIKLEDSHREAIEFVLDFYEHCEDCRNARQLMTVMDQEFADKGGKKYLYRLFPKGPLSQIHKLANLPNLGNQTDKGFGTSY